MVEEKLILLDTDIIIEALDKNSYNRQKSMFKIIEGDDEEYYTSSFNRHELNCGIEKYRKDSGLVLQIPTLEYNRKDSELSGFSELNAETNGKAVPMTDVIIGSIEIDNSFSLYKLDDHFEVFIDNGIKLFR